MLCDLTGMDAANASHYDAATAAAEAAVMAINSVRNGNKIIVSPTLHPHYRATMRTYLEGQKIPIVGDENVSMSLDAVLDKHLDNQTAGVLVANPDFLGNVRDLKPIATASTRRARCSLSARIRLRSACINRPPLMTPTLYLAKARRSATRSGLAVRISASLRAKKNICAAWRASHRSNDRHARAARFRLDPASARAAHSPRKSHVQYLHQRSVERARRVRVHGDARQTRSAPSRGIVLSQSALRRARNRQTRRLSRCHKRIL